MEMPVQELLADFLQAASVNVADAEIDAWLQRLIDDAQASSAVLKRDMRRLLEKDAAGFLQSACRILKVRSQQPGVASMLDLLWSSPVLLGSLIDASMLPLPTAIAFAKRWAAFDPMLDIKLLSIGFPSIEADGEAVADAVGSMRALEIVSELPPNRHVLQPLARLLRSPDAYVRSKVALMYARASDNPEWVRKMLADPDARIRANAVEGLWETKAPSAGAAFREAVLDSDHRVQINALLGLHYIGDTSVDVRAAFEKIISSPEPAIRAAVAFAMGRIMDSSCVPALEGLLKDEDQQVRRQALQSLISIRRHNRREGAQPQPPEAPPSPEPARATEISPAEAAKPAPVQADVDPPDTTPSHTPPDSSPVKA
jgi:HEAT repeat protein